MRERSNTTTLESTIAEKEQELKALQELYRICPDSYPCEYNTTFTIWVVPTMKVEECDQISLVRNPSDSSGRGQVLFSKELEGGVRVGPTFHGMDEDTLFRKLRSNTPTMKAMIYVFKEEVEELEEAKKAILCLEDSRANPNARWNTQVRMEKAVQEIVNRDREAFLKEHEDCPNTCVVHDEIICGPGCKIAQQRKEKEEA